jgi:hypothetical protein
MMDFSQVWMRIQQAIPAEGKSPACKDQASCQQPIFRRFRMNPIRQKTRPSAQYNANGLASPGY